MEMELGGLTLAMAVIALVAVVAAAVAATRGRAAHAALERDRVVLAQQQTKAVEATTRLSAAEIAIAELKAERDAAAAERETARAALAEAQTAVAVANQAREAMVEQRKSWEAAKAESLNHAKAAVLTTAQEVSSKLLADHKRETVAAKKESEEQVKKTTESLTRHFEGVAKSVAALHDQVVGSKKTIDTVWRALSSPGGAGAYSEMVLENSLKSFGLERGRDFLIEHTINDVVDGKRLRPDAVVYLPFDSVLVIDSKASKFLLELADAESEDDADAAAAGLARTMNQHLRALAGKDYQRAIVDSYRAAGRAGEIRRVLNVMYLPNEGAVEKLKRADPGFEGKAAKERIIIAGPSGLNSIIAFASLEIDLGRQAENQERIVESTQRLLESTGIVLGHIDKVGKGIRSAAQNFINLTGSINRRLLPRAHELASLGVRPAKNKDLPKSVAAYELVDRAGDGVIEGEAEEVAENNLIGHDDSAG